MADSRPLALVLLLLLLWPTTEHFLCSYHLFLPREPGQPQEAAHLWSHRAGHLRPHAVTRDKLSMDGDGPWNDVPMDEDDPMEEDGVPPAGDQPPQACTHCRASPHPFAMARARQGFHIGRW